MKIAKNFIISFICSWAAWAFIWKVIKTVKEPKVTTFGMSTENGYLAYKNAINISENSLIYGFWSAVVITFFMYIARKMKNK
jgi:hypothetical protein